MGEDWLHNEWTLSEVPVSLLIHCVTLSESLDSSASVYSSVTGIVMAAVLVPGQL